MMKPLITIAFVALTFTAMAQGKDVSVTDTPEMMAKAKDHTELVDRTVKLSPEQRELVQELYMEVERYSNALEQRFDGQPEEVRQADMPAQYANMDAHVDARLGEILRPEQYAVWKEASK
ncbi:MAG: hypothetical protein H6595_10545 [Flavobacteriales bacterium]|nr:hypothetical protein [Flavobacteriales bacterium]MCB9167901.1 hypothetical protein [Flavobacteriales bacterium]